MLACILVVAITMPVPIQAFATRYLQRFSILKLHADLVENSSDVWPYNSCVKSVFVIAPKTTLPLGTPGKLQRALIGGKDGGIQSSLVGLCSFAAIPRAPVVSPAQTEPPRFDKVARHYVLFASPTSGHAPLTVTFTATGLQSSISFIIDYGDGSTSNSLHPVNICTAPVGGNFAGCPTIVISHT